MLTDTGPGTRNICLTELQGTTDLVTDTITATVNFQLVQSEKSLDQIEDISEVLSLVQNALGSFRMVLICKSA